MQKLRQENCICTNVLYWIKQYVLISAAIWKHAVQAQVKSDNAVPTEARLSPSSSPVHNNYTLLTAKVHDVGTKAEFKEVLFDTLLTFRHRNFLLNFSTPCI